MKRSIIFNRNNTKFKWKYTNYAFAVVRSHSVSLTGTSMAASMHFSNTPNSTMIFGNYCSALDDDDDDGSDDNKGTPGRAILGRSTGIWTKLVYWKWM